MYTKVILELRIAQQIHVYHFPGGRYGNCWWIVVLLLVNSCYGCDLNPFGLEDTAKPPKEMQGMGWLKGIFGKGESASQEDEISAEHQHQSGNLTPSGTQVRHGYHRLTQSVGSINPY